jgi:hypothetical protein
MRGILSGYASDVFQTLLVDTPSFQALLPSISINTMYWKW